jgi:hypothetical protein
MPQIIVAADRGAAFGEGAVTFRERVNVTDFESEHFAAQLVERLGWAVEDADVVERTQPESSGRNREVEGRGGPVDRVGAVDEGEPVDKTGRVHEGEPVDEAARADEGAPAGEPEPSRIRLAESAAVHAPA